MSDSLNADDLADIRRSLSGDGDAYARLITRHQQFVAARMSRFTRDRGTLAELVQDVFVEAYIGLRGFRAVAPFDHWLARIATRRGYRFWKSRQRRQQEESLTVEGWNEVAAAKETVASAETAADHLHAVLERLAPRDRLVLTLMYFDDCNVAQIAERTGWSQIMVKVQAFRARGRLRKLLDASGGSKAAKDVSAMKPASDLNSRQLLDRGTG